jgi:outer membrane protein TolC
LSIDPRVRSVACVTLLALGACSVESYAADADADVDEVLAQATAETIGGLPERVVRPEPAKPAAEPTPKEPPADQPTPAPTDAPPLALDLDTALRLSVQGSREYQTQREQLYQQGLSFTSTRFRFGPQLDNTISAVFNDRETSRGVLSLDTNAAVSQILPTGGFVALDGRIGFDHFSGPNTDSWATNAGIRLRQPLLQGAGYTVSHESWTQAQREIVYEVRSFERFRQRFAIEIARDYFGLTSQKRTLANQERTYNDAVFDRRKAEALFSVDRITDDQQVFRARRREIETENALIDARAQYARALDAFRVRLGLPDSVKVAVRDQDPEYAPLDMDDESAVRAALANRLDLATQRDRVQDSERQLAIAANGLLPDLNLGARYGLDGTGPQLDRASPHDWSSSVDLTMEVPLQRTQQRNNLRSAQIAVAQAARAYDLAKDQLAIEVRDQLRQLRSIEQQIALQREQIEQEQRAVAVMQIRYESGNVDNRDLLEARQALIEAENALIRLLVDHFVRRLDLHYSIGVLFIDVEGKWQ